MFLAQPLAVVAIHDGQVLIDNDRRVAAIAKQIRFQGCQLLPTQRGEQFGQLRQHHRLALGAAVQDACVPHGQAASQTSG